MPEEHPASGTRVEQWFNTHAQLLSRAMRERTRFTRSAQSDRRRGERRLSADRRKQIKRYDGIERRGHNRRSDERRARARTDDGVSRWLFTRERRRQID